VSSATDWSVGQAEALENDEWIPLHVLLARLGQIPVNTTQVRVRVRMRVRVRVRVRLLVLVLVRVRVHTRVRARVGYVTGRRIGETQWDIQWPVAGGRTAQCRQAVYRVQRRKSGYHFSTDTLSIDKAGTIRTLPQHIHARPSTCKAETSNMSYSTQASCVSPQHMQTVRSAQTKARTQERYH